MNSIPVDPAGAYLASVPAGAYSVGLAGGGFRNRTFVTVEAGKTSTLDLTWTDSADDPSAGFGGSVLEADGSPSPGATVRMVGLGGGSFFFGIAADENGKFHLDRARTDLPDNFDLQAFNGGRSGRVAVAPQQKEANIALQPAATLRGHLAGGGADSFRVDVTVSGHGFFGRIAQSLEFTGERFEMTDVPGLSVHVVVTTDDGRSAALEVQLSPGAAQDVEIPLQPLATVRGRLLDGSTQAPVPDVTLSIDGRGSQTSTVSSGDGRFQLRAPAGKHTLRGFVQRFRPVQNDFSVDAGQMLDLGDLTMQRMAAQPGTVGMSLRGDSETRPTVMFLIPDGPAEKAGVHLGDQVTSVDGKPVTGVSDAVSRIQGAPGTPVQIAIDRSGTALGFTITRAP